MKKVLKAVWTETDLIDVKDGDMFKFTEEGTVFIADGDAYFGEGNDVLIKTLEDTMRYEDDGK